MYAAPTLRDAVPDWPISRLVAALARQQPPFAWWCARGNGSSRGYVDPLCRPPVDARRR
jgi:hypothetical protein